MSGSTEILEEASLEALRSALSDLRRDLRREPRKPDEAGLPAPEPAVRASPPAQPEPPPAPTPKVVRDAAAFAGFDEVRRRLGSLGMAERTDEVDAFGMDPQALRQMRPALDFLMDRFWRVEVIGRDRLPEGPVLLVANHSGLLPYDGLMLAHAVERIREGGERPRFLVADWLMTQPFAQPYLARIGGVRACRENADRLLRTGHSVIAFPEGARGAAKVFADRYRVKRFGRGGVIRTAIENGVPLVPVGIVGAEEANPLLFKAGASLGTAAGTALGAAARAAGLPFVPVTPTFPWLGPFGLLPLPTKWILNIGEPVALDRAGTADLEDEALLAQLTEGLRGRIQALVDDGLSRRDSVWG